MTFSVDSLFLSDLKDDFVINDKHNLYEFLNKDPVKAFHLGVYINKWFYILDMKQKYLHSKFLRHNYEDIECYIDQIKHWTQAFPCSSEKDQINVIELAEYIFKNIIWNKETEDIDKVKVALFLGMIAGKDSTLNEEELVYSVC